jgi:hypothetical protein
VGFGNGAERSSAFLGNGAFGLDGKGLVVSKKKIRNLEFFLPSKEVLVTGSVKAAGEDVVVPCRKADKPNVFHPGVYRFQSIGFNRNVFSKRS